MNHRSEGTMLRRLHPRLDDALQAPGRRKAQQMAKALQGEMPQVRDPLPAVVNLVKHCSSVSDISIISYPYRMLERKKPGPSVFNLFCM